MYNSIGNESKQSVDSYNSSNVALHAYISSIVIGQRSRTIHRLLQSAQLQSHRCVFFLFVLLMDSDERASQSPLHTKPA